MPLELNRYPFYRNSARFYSAWITNHSSLKEPSMPTRDVVFPAGRQALYERNRYSPAVRSNGFLFVSGQVGSREDGSPEPDVAAQVRLAFSNLNAVLQAAGCTFDDVVDVTMFVVNPEANFETIWGHRARVLGRGALPHADGHRGELAVRLSVRDQGDCEAARQRRLMVEILNQIDR